MTGEATWVRLHVIWNVKRKIWGSSAFNIPYRHIYLIKTTSLYCCMHLHKGGVLTSYLPFGVLRCQNSFTVLVITVEHCDKLCHHPRVQNSSLGPVNFTTPSVKWTSPFLYDSQLGSDISTSIKAVRVQFSRDDINEWRAHCQIYKGEAFCWNVLDQRAHRSEPGLIEVRVLSMDGQASVVTSSYRRGEVGEDSALSIPQRSASYIVLGVEWFAYFFW